MYKRQALEFAGLTGTELAVDLYCGAGTITQVLARQARHVIGGEIVPEAIRDARASVRRNGVANVEFLGGDAADVAAELTLRQLRPDVICVDPPRKGPVSYTHLDVYKRQVYHTVQQMGCSS